MYVNLMNLESGDCVSILLNKSFKLLNILEFYLNSRKRLLRLAKTDF